MPSSPAALLVPVKAFAVAKARLGGFLTDSQRATLARAMAGRVLGAAGGLPTFVVCDDAAVRDWAVDRGAEVIWSPGRGLNGAVTDGVAELAGRDYTQVLVAHADLPYATDLGRLVDDDQRVTMVPDRRDDGTNVICVPAQVGFTFGYGPGSFRRHCAEAERLGLAAHVERDPALAWDVDLPSDLDPTLAAELGIELPLVGEHRP